MHTHRRNTHFCHFLVLVFLLPTFLAVSKVMTCVWLSPLDASAFSPVALAATRNRHRERERMAVQRGGGGGGGGGGTKHITNKQRCARKNINTTKAIQRNTYKKDNSTNNNINKRRNKTKKEDALNRLRGNALATEEKEATLPCPVRYDSLSFSHRH